MKNLTCITVLFIIGMNICFADYDKKNWNIDIYIEEPSDYLGDLIREKIIVEKIPKEWSKYYYNDIDIYDHEILTYGDNTITFFKYFSYNNGEKKDTILNVDKNNYLYGMRDNFDEVCKKLPVLQETMMHDKFECTVYDVYEYAKKHNYKGKFLTVVKLNGNIVWYSSDSRLGDIKEINKDNYMVSALNCTYYVHINGNIKIIEQFALPFTYGNSAHTGIRDPFPILCDILTDNIIRLEYKDGAVEHWKVRLSKEDVEKNMEVAKKDGLSEGKIINSKRNSLIWWNEIGKGSPTGMTINIESDGKEKLTIDKKNVKIWNYDDNSTREPVYENML